MFGNQNFGLTNRRARIAAQVNQLMADAQIRSTLEIELGEISGALGFKNLDRSYRSSLTAAFTAIRIGATAS